jgi:hypothetical protein
MPWVTCVQAIKQERPSWVNGVDCILGFTKDYMQEVHTEDLPASTLYFGGPLQLEQKDIDEGSLTDIEI